MSDFWDFVIVCVIFGSIVSIVKLSLVYGERIMRIKHGYPLKDGSEKIKKEPEDKIIDYRSDRQQ